MSLLLTEIIACITAAAFLSLFIGWAIRNTLANREIAAVNADWEKKQSEQELILQQDKEILEDQVSSLSYENRKLNKASRGMSESLRNNELIVQKARTDAIELNRKQADTQERLQRIIAQKDQEIKSLKEQVHSASALSATLAKQSANETKTTSDRLASLSAKREAWEKERKSLMQEITEEQATQAIEPGDVPPELLDQTVRINQQKLELLKSRTQSNFESDLTQTLEEPLDDPTLSIKDKDKH